MQEIEEAIYQEWNRQEEARALRDRELDQFVVEINRKIDFLLNERAKNVLLTNA